MTPGPREGTSRPSRKMTARSYSRRTLRPLTSSTTPISTNVITAPSPPMTISPFYTDPAGSSLDHRPVSSFVARHRLLTHWRNIATPARRIGLFFYRETTTDMAEEELPPLPELSHVSALLAHAFGYSWREPQQLGARHHCYGYAGFFSHGPLFSFSATGQCVANSPWRGRRYGCLTALWPDCWRVTPALVASAGKKVSRRSFFSNGSEEKSIYPSAQEQ